MSVRRASRAVFFFALAALLVTALQPLPAQANKVNCCGGGGDTPLECTEHDDPVFQCAWQSQCNVFCCAEYCVVDP